MKTKTLASRPRVAAALLISCALAPLAAADQPEETLPGFVLVPPGVVNPGCTPADVELRSAGGDLLLKEAVWYDTWGSLPPGSIQLPALLFGRREVTNAQWKHYLDANFRAEHTTSGQETLENIAARYVKFRDTDVSSEWGAIFAFNAEAIRDAMIKADAEAAAKARAENQIVPAPKWQKAWTLQNPDPNNTGELGRIILPAGIKLNLYRHRTPSHWYGWCRLSRLRVGKEFCDIAKPAAEAFKVPETELFRELDLRDGDFARYPVRDLSPNEVLGFAEWAGAHLPSEYEWERGGRADRPNTEKYTFAGPWDRHKQTSVFAWLDNEACRKGPLPVDDASVQHSDSPFGARHMIGNVWEMTRTFFDYHPRLAPKPREAPYGTFNFALTVKGGSWGDPWIFMQLSARTGHFNRNTIFDLTGNNRADTLGFRLVRHIQPGYDLALHSILRMTYDRGRGAWHPRFLPHSFALPRMAGIDRIAIEGREAPYVHVRGPAAGVVFVPLWVADMSDQARKQAENRWRQGRATGREFEILGILRSDVPLRAGRRLEAAEAAALVKARAEYEELAEKARKQPKKLKEGEERIVLPPKPPEPDAYELAMGKNTEAVGLWREGVLPPGEWVAVYWYGFLGLANKTLLMPPDAILPLEGKKKALRERQPAEPATFAVNAEQDIVNLKFWVEEQPMGAKEQRPPGQQDSELWALCEVHPDGWPGRKKGKYRWGFEVNLTFEKGALSKLTAK